VDEMVLDPATNVAFRAELESLPRRH
jgi:hypothetical protein